MVGLLSRLWTRDEIGGRHVKGVDVGEEKTERESIGPGASATRVDHQA
jgi:hypothetical protein